MIIVRSVALRVLGPLFALVSLGGSCGKSRIEGTVAPYEIRATPGQSVPLSLSVSADASDKTHGEYWVVEPASLGEVTPGPGGGRHAIFTAKAIGSGTVTAYAYYRPQTSPQPVAKVGVVVAAPAGAAVSSRDAPFCDRFKQAIPGCWCSGEQPRIAETRLSVPDEAAAVALVTQHLEAIQGRRAARGGAGAPIEPSKLRCTRVQAGFFNCFAEPGYVATVSSVGEIYLTECGV